MEDQRNIEKIEDIVLFAEYLRVGRLFIRINQNRADTKKGVKNVLRYTIKSREKEKRRKRVKSRPSSRNYLESNNLFHKL